jgi:ABC-type sulfate transport system permease subunit
MSDRTMLLFGRSTYSVPKATKRAFQVLVAVGVTALTILIVLSLNNVLTAHSGWRAGFDAWLAFIRRSDILGTMILTAAVTVISVYWTPENSSNSGGKK